MVRMRMFRKMFPLCLPLAVLLFASQCVIPGMAAAATVKVQIGTPVELQFVDTVNGDTASPGQVVNLRVSVPVTVDGKTVIAAGAPATGEVSDAGKSNLVGIPGRITVSMRNVTAVDGTIIALNGTKSLEGKSNMVPSIAIGVLCCILGFLMKGGKAEIPSGATLRATVAAQVDVNAE